MNNDGPIQDWETGDAPTPEQARIDRAEALADEIELDENTVPIMSDADLGAMQAVHREYLAERAKQVDAHLRHLMRAYPFPKELLRDCEAAMGVTNEAAR